jgi:hypothetical protein
MATDNEKKTLDYGAFLADLEAKRAALDQAIASLKAVMAAGSTEGMSAVNLGATLVNPVMHGGEVPAGAFHGMRIPAAAKLYLSIVNKKQTTKEIADGLREGGMETAGKDFDIIVGSALYRITKGAANGEIVRLKGGYWGLAAWWPAGVRTSQDKPNGRKTKKARKQKSVKANETSTPQSAAESNGHNKAPQERIADLLRSNPMKIYTPQQVSQELGMKTQAVAPTLGRLVSSNVAEKIESGKYRAAHG